MKFDKEKCEVRTVMYKDSVKTSYYKMTAEVGPAISFDTYNWLMHYFSNPSFQNIEAFRGDFIFVVDSLSENLIKVHGARTKNVMYLRKLEVPAEEYIQNTAAFKTAFTKRNSGLSREMKKERTSMQKLTPSHSTSPSTTTGSFQPRPSHSPTKACAHTSP